MEHKLLIFGEIIIITFCWQSILLRPVFMQALQ